jgi:serine protease Do
MSKTSLRMIRNRFLLLSALTTIPLFPVSAAVEPAPAPASQAKDLIHQLDDAFVGVFEKVAPSVVVIEAEKEGDDQEAGDEGQTFDFFFRSPPGGGGNRPFRLPRPTHSEGSGFIIRPNGYIITNNHVIEDAEKVKVKLKDGRQFPAKVVGSDDRTDVAVLKVEAENLPAATLANSDTVRVGQLCFAIGIPFNLDYSFSGGYVSAKGRSGLMSSANKPMYEDYIQTDAFINPGNSGGPLFDVDGQVIGMNTLINGIGRGLAFAIPSNMLREVSDQLVTNGRIVRPWLGIRIETLGENSSLREHIRGIEKGVVVDTIEEAGPALKSDLRPADVVTHVDGSAVATARELQKEILKKKVGQSVELTVWRNGKTLKVPVVTGELPTDIRNAANTDAKPEPAAPPADTYGVQLQDLTPELAQQLKVTAKAGALVNDVQEGTAAASADVQRGDVITEVDEKPVANAAEARKLMKESDPKRGALLFIERKGQKTYTVLKPVK